MTDKTKTQEDLAKEALRIKQENETPANHPTDQTADTGMQRIDNQDQAPSGAFDHAGDKPSRERSRERR